MPGGQERVLKRRIRSIESTKKITRAMELIAASRIVKAQARVQAARPYSEQITEVIRNLASAGGTEVDSPLLERREQERKVAFVVLTADRGLCGAYNSSVIRAAERVMESEAGRGRDTALVTVGRKAESYFRFRGYAIDDVFTGMSDQPTYEDAKQVAAAVAARFEEGDIDRVELVYTRFVSVGTQRVTQTTLMPLDPSELTGDGEGRVEAAQPSPQREPSPELQAAYEFEPEPAAILTRLLPRYIEARLFAAQLDAAASEHAARQRAMKSATDNAEELITSLTRVMNRARQDAITTEIMEVVGGAEALRKGTRLLAEDLLVDTVEGRRADLFAARVNEHG
jgi:F-type H+-transporting ATPase subunit gamma